MEDIKWTKLNLDKTEAKAKGTQIKYMLGIKDGKPITVQQLKYLKDNLVNFKSIDGNMQAFLNSITDFDSAASWLSRNSYSLSAAINLLGIIKLPRGCKGF